MSGNNEESFWKKHIWKIIFGVLIGIAVAGIIVIALVNFCYFKDGVGPVEQKLTFNQWIGVMIGILGFGATAGLGCIAVWQNVKQREENRLNLKNQIDENIENTRKQLEIIKLGQDHIENKDVKTTITKVLKSFDYHAVVEILQAGIAGDGLALSSKRMFCQDKMNEAKVELDCLKVFNCNLKNCKTCNNPCSIQAKFSEIAKSDITEIKSCYYTHLQSYQQLCNEITTSANYFYSNQCNIKLLNANKSLHKQSQEQNLYCNKTESKEPCHEIEKLEQAIKDLEKEILTKDKTDQIIKDITVKIDKNSAEFENVYINMLRFINIIERETDRKYEKLIDKIENEQVKE